MSARAAGVTADADTGAATGKLEDTKDTQFDLAQPEVAEDPHRLILSLADG
jgi:hypothetical protein